jgi:uncharacterized repeat protein (TIGR02543 family)
MEIIIMPARTEVDLQIFLAEYRSGHAVVQIAFHMAFDSPLEMGKKVRISQTFTPCLGFYPFNTSLPPYEVPDEVRKHAESIIELGEARLYLAIDRGRGGLAGFFDEVLVRNWSGRGFPFWNLEWLRGREVEIPYYPDAQCVVAEITVYGLKVRFRDGQVFEQPQDIGLSSGFARIAFNQLGGKSASKSTFYVTDIMWFPHTETGARLEVQPDLATVGGSLAFKWIGIGDAELQEKWGFISSTWTKIAGRFEAWLACTQGVPIGSVHVKSYTMDILGKSLRVEFEARNLLERSGSDMTLTLLNPFRGKFEIPPGRDWDLCWLQGPYYLGVHKPYFFSEAVSVVPPSGIEGTRCLLLDFSPTTGAKADNSVTWYAQASESYSAKFKVQYYLTVRSPYNNAEGEGWYDAGSTAPLAVTHTLVDCRNGTRRVFTGWTGDLKTSSSSASILMDSPKTVTACWKTQYYLTVKSDYDEPQGEGWYDEGSIATFSITRPVVGFIVQRVFVGWTGDSAATAPTATILMNAPKAVTASWRTDYSQLFAIIVAIAVGAASAWIVTKRRRIH